MSNAKTFFQEHKKENIETLFIVETSGTILFNFYPNLLDRTTNVLWNEKYRLKDKNVNTCFVIDKGERIILEGDFANEKETQKEHFYLIKELSITE